MYPSVVSKPAILSKWKNNGVRLTGIDVLQSWTKNCRQIHEIKQNRFFMGGFTADFMRLFTEERQNLAFGRTAGYSPSNPSIPGIFLNN